MFYRIRQVPLALLLALLLFSCTSASQRPKAAPVPPASTPTSTPAWTSTPTQTVFHLDRSALAYGIFETEATSLTIEVANTVPGQFKDFADISVEDGTGITTYKVEAGEVTIVHPMASGKKQVTVTAGLQTKFRNKITGVFIDKIIFNGSAVQMEQDARKVLVYGDSLTVGGNVDHVSAEAWPVLLRKHFSVKVEAYGYRALHDDGATAEARAEFASQISSWRPDKLWLAIGANDYAFGLWSAGQFGEAYAATLDLLHSANPQVTVFAQSPIHQADESPNSFGDTLEDYRRQISIACRARSAWCIFVDGTAPAFPQPNELYEDGIHLTTKSSAKYAETVLQILGQ